MENRIVISTNGINAYIKIRVNASKIGTRILSFFVIAEVIAVLVGLFHIKSEEVVSLIIPILIIIFLFIGLPLKYLLWNLFGNEVLIVNTKSISWSYDYGFFKTNLKTVKYHRLGTAYDKVRGEKEEEVGRLTFYNFREEDNLLEFIHQTTILLSREDIQNIDRQISDIFTNDFLNQNGFIPFSAN